MKKEHGLEKNQGSKKTDRKEKCFIAGEETEEQFNGVLSRLSEWVKAGVVNLDIDADGGIRFELPAEMVSLLGDEAPAGLTSDDVREIVRTEIPVLLSARLRKDARGWLGSVLPEQIQGKVDVMLERSKKAFPVLVDQNLKERLLLRKATPSYVAPSIRRAASATYHVESGEGEKVDVPAVCLEFEFAKPGSGYILEIAVRESRVATRRKDDVRVAVDVHKDDVDDLIKKLSKIKEEMISERRG